MQRMESNKSEELERILSIIKEDITKDQIKIILKVGTDSMRQGTYGKILESDKEYQEACEEIQQVRKQYMKLDISEGQREVVDTLIARHCEAEFESVADSYMAGILDGYRILKAFDLTIE